MHYYTYWSILDTPSTTIQSSSIFLYMALVAGLIWVLTKRLKKDNGDGDRTLILWVTSAFALLGFAGYVSLTSFYPENTNERALEMLNSPTIPIAEGIVSDFERTYRNARHGKEVIEKFSVDSVQFAYGDAASGKFNSFTQTNNSVIFNGQRVRITYKSDSPYGEAYRSILRLEVVK